LGGGHSHVEHIRTIDKMTSPLCNDHTKALRGARTRFDTNWSAGTHKVPITTFVGSHHGGAKPVGEIDPEVAGVLDGKDESFLKLASRQAGQLRHLETDSSRDRGSGL
jgi:hypothetical protein